MSTLFYENEDCTGLYAAIRKCDHCGVERPMRTKSGLPSAWLRSSIVPPGWMLACLNGHARHYCKAWAKTVRRKHQELRRLARAAARMGVLPRGGVQ